MILEQPTPSAPPWAEDPDLRGIVERLQLQVRRDLEALRERSAWTEPELETAAGVAPGTLRGPLLDLAAIAALAYASGWLIDVRFRRPSRRPTSGRL